MIIAVDFDGTCVTHDYPHIGRPIGAEKVLKALIEESHVLILFTMRSNKELDEAVEWFNERQIPLLGINSNPTQYKWTSSPKAYAQLYIDDAALGCPLHNVVKVNGVEIEHERAFVNWPRVFDILIEQKILTNKHRD